MNAVSVAPLRRALSGARVRVPASASATTRELLLSAVADGRSRIALGPLEPGEDVHLMTEALRALGHEIDRDADRITVVPHRSAYAHATVEAAASPLVGRLVTALAAVGDSEVRVEGTARGGGIPAILHALRSLGASASADALPLAIRGPAHGGDLELHGRDAALVASTLLLVGPRMTEGLRIRVERADTTPVEAAIAALHARGVRVMREGPRIAVGPQRIHGRSIAIPGDATLAMPFAAAAAILGGDVTIANVSARIDESGGGEVRCFDLLAAMGCRVSRAAGSTTVARRGALHGVVADVAACADVLPAIAVAATQAESPTELTGLAGAARRHDTIGTVATGLRELGGEVTAYPDGLRIVPRPLHGGTVDAQGNEHVAMAFAALGLQVPGVAISGAEGIARVFPAFYEVLATLRTS